MNCYQCADCGEKWYSSAGLNYMFIEKICDNCGGEVDYVETIKCDEDE